MRQCWCECISAGRVSDVIGGAQCKCLGVRSVPFSTTRDLLFSIYFRINEARVSAVLM